MTFHDAQQEGLVRLYLDDVVIPAIDEQTALEKLEKTLKIAALNVLNINFNKCKFLRKIFTIFGFYYRKWHDETVRRKDKGNREIPNAEDGQRRSKFPWINWILSQIYRRLRNDCTTNDTITQKRGEIHLWARTTGSIQRTEREYEF